MNRRSLRSLSVTVAVALAAAFAGLAGSPAFAENGISTAASHAGSSAHVDTVKDTDLEFSTDDVTWSSLPPATLFDPSFVIAPGDTESSLLYVRSTRSDPTAISASIGDVTSNNKQLAAALHIVASTGSGTRLNSTIASLGTCAKVSAAETVSQNQSIPIRVSLALARSLKGLEGQKAQLDFSLNVLASDVGSTATPPGCSTPTTSIPAFTSDGGGIRLAFTGTNSLYPALIVAAVVFTIGLLFVLIGKRRRRKSPEGERQ